MKKIVALVLALVLALSLATVAFGAETKGSVVKTSLDEDDYTLYEYTEGTDGRMKATEKKDYITSIEKQTHEDDVNEKGTHTVYAVGYCINGTEYYYVVDSDCADYKLVDGDDNAIYVKKDTEWAVKTTKTATAFVEAKDEDDQTCGDIVEDSYVIGGKYYPADGTSAWALYNGKFVQYDSANTTARVQHKFTADSKVIYKTGTNNGFKFDTLSAIVCDTCKKELALVAAEDLDKDLTDNEVQRVAYGKAAGLYIVLGTEYAAPGAAESTTGVKSAQTFDAGVALYAGMALMSVAGSAVVIGKKKEF